MGHKQRYGRHSGTPEPHCQRRERDPRKRSAMEDGRQPVDEGERPDPPRGFCRTRQRNRSSNVRAGHAPYDYQALIEVKARYESSPEPHESLEKIQPVSIIRLEGFSEFPAADIVKKFDVKGQDDPRLEDATKELYSKEFHNGVMNDNARPYSGMSVENAREAVVRDLTSSGKMSIMYELLNKPLVCRCGAKLVVHVVDKQWFINYGEPEWKKQAHQCLDEMTILPEERRNEFNYAIDWLRERACARKVGLGTK